MRSHEFHGKGSIRYNGTERICSRLGDRTFSLDCSASLTPQAQQRLGTRIMQVDQNFRAELLELVEAGDVPVEFPNVLNLITLLPAGSNANSNPNPNSNPHSNANTSNDIFYYHTNHLGSTAFVTDNNATVTQGFLYAPFGEITTEYNANFGNDVLPKYSFNAKELDEETGMYYYEARYYKPPVFTSRDPMFEKYFWMTPYAYCANNPVKYVDPDGNTVVITGEDFTTAFNSLQKGTNLRLYINEKGVLSCSGDILNENDQMLYDAITSSDVTVNIEAYSESTSMVSYEDNLILLTAGSYMGTNYDPDTKSATSTNYVRMDLLSKMEKKGAEGSGMMHEITEGYLLGKKSIEMQKDINPAIKQPFEFNIGAGNYMQKINDSEPLYPEDYKIYNDYGHTKATKAPNEMTRKQAKYYKEPTFFRQLLKI